MNFYRLIVAALLVLAVGCASHPGDIAPAFVPPSQYQGLSCEELDIALAESTGKLARATKRQKNKRTMDGFGNVLLIPGLMSLAPDSREAVALHKGEIKTISNEQGQRCRKVTGQSVPV